MAINAFLDDKRTPPDGFVHVTSVKECQDLMLSGPVDILCLDHGLGRGNPSGYDLVQWMIDQRKYTRKIYLHSGNYLEKRAMKKALELYVEAAQLDTEIYDTPFLR